MEELFFSVTTCHGWYVYDLQSYRNSLTPDALCPHIIMDYLSM